jgi:hypothetical protein
MKNTTINSLEYSGTVTISMGVGTKKVNVAKIQNTGKQSLFNFFADCLVGDFDVAEAERPNKIMLLHYNAADDRYESRSGFIYGRPEKIYNSSEGVVCYSFTITRDKLENITFDSIGLFSHATKNLENDNFVAIVDNVQDKLNKKNLSVSSALVIDWELHISNKDKEIARNV